MLSNVLVAQIPLILGDDDVEVNDDGVLISVTYQWGAISGDIALEIPDELDGQEVKYIASDILTNKNLSSLTLPNGLLEIAEGTFSNNKLSSVKIPANVRYIRTNAFSSNLLETVEIMNESYLLQIEKDAFYNNPDLKSFTIPQSGYSDFLKCQDQFGNLYEEGDVTNQVQNIYYFRRAPYTLTVEDVAFSNGIITSFNPTNEQIMEILIPNNFGGEPVLAIGEQAFQEKNLLSVVFSEGLRTISVDAFRDNNLVEIDLSSTLENIGERAFQTNNLKDVVFPEGITTITENSFSSNNLESVTLPTSLKIIESNAFFLNHISNLTIPESVTEIQERAFYDNKLTSLLFLENSNLTTIEVEAFGKNPNLNQITFPRNVNEIATGYRAQDGKIYELGMPISNFDHTNSYVLQIPYTLTKDDVEIDQDGMITSCKYSFDNKEIIIPSHFGDQPVIGISQDVFFRKNIVSVVFPEGLKLIGKNAFDENELKKIILPKTIETIESSAFDFNTPSSIVFLEPSNLVEIQEKAFVLNELPDRKFLLPKNQNEYVVGYSTFDENDVETQLTPLSDGSFYYQNRNLHKVVEGIKITMFNNFEEVVEENYYRKSGELINLFPFERDGYTLTSWNDKEDGNGDEYPHQNKFSVPSTDITLYAQWEANKIIITYNPNYDGSSEQPKTNESNTGSEITLLGEDDSFTRNGYILLGWSTSPSSVIFDYKSKSLYKVPSQDVIFYAVWSESATVTFVSNYEGSTSEDVPMPSYVGEALTLSGDTFIRLGYTLTGWNAADNDGGEVLPTGSIYEVKAREVMLYAQWEANEVALAYNANYEGSTNQDIRQDSRTDESVMLLGSDAFTRAGYTLTSWNTQPDGLGDSFALGVDYVTPSEGMTFYAQWEANEVAISYNANYEGSTEEDKTQNSKTDESVMLLGSNAFTREGYTLTDWNTQSDGLGDSFALGVDYVTPSEGMTFYAVWEKEETVLSLSDELNGSTMQSYPNPVQNMLTVERSKAMRGQVNVRVFNMVGKEVYSKVYGVSDDYMEVDFSALPMGMYFLQMSDENGDSERTRIMKR